MWPLTACDTPCNWQDNCFLFRCCISLRLRGSHRSSLICGQGTLGELSRHGLTVVHLDIYPSSSMDWGEEKNMREEEGWEAESPAPLRCWGARILPFSSSSFFSLLFPEVALHAVSLCCFNGHTECTVVCTEACMYHRGRGGGWGGGVNVGGHKASSTELLVECCGKMRQRNADSTEQCKQAGLRECCHAALKSLHLPITHIHSHTRTRNTTTNTSHSIYN